MTENPITALTGAHPFRIQELGFHFADRLAADCVEDGVGSVFLADPPADPDDPEALGRYWRDRTEALARFEEWAAGHDLTTAEVRVRRAERQAEYNLAFEYLSARGLLEFHPERPELYRVKELGPAPEVMPK